ncbi:MAG: DUF1598 domain-containing protein [Pirellulales bacterium]|nr:DUF1598 domain-containing protein [Pirellulales bacterium]
MPSLTETADLRIRRQTRIRRFLSFLAACVANLVLVTAHAAPGDGGGPSNQSSLDAGGGAASADFDSLIELITSTVQRDTWMENGTGEGEIQAFPNGVYIDAAGALRLDRGERRNDQLERVAGRAATARSIAEERPLTRPDEDDPAAAARRPSELRFVSLPRLERAIAARQARGQPLDPAMLTLAGLRRIAYIVVEPESGDLLLAGPAGDWRVERGALVAADTARPLVRLDDLLTLLRRNHLEGAKAFGCSIVPRQEALAATQDFLARTSTAPLPAGGRGEWLRGLRDALGEQDVEFYSIEASTRVARLLLAADYHMKLVGMGLAQGVPGVPSYLSTVQLGPDGRPPAMTVIRWWFSMPACQVATTPDRTAYALPEQCVEVLSENELLAARGERIHTGISDDLTGGFARAFTREFAALAAKYPVYAEMERVFELALALAVVEREGLLVRSGWTPGLLADPERLRLPRVTTPRSVETVVNHRTIARRHVIAGVSGGVWVNPVTQASIVPAPAGEATALAEKATSRMQPDVVGDEQSWWWD